MNLAYYAIIFDDNRTKVKIRLKSNKPFAAIKRIFYFLQTIET